MREPCSKPGWIHQAIPIPLVAGSRRAHLLQEQTLLCCATTTTVAIWVVQECYGAAAAAAAPNGVGPHAHHHAPAGQVVRVPPLRLTPVEGYQGTIGAMVMDEASQLLAFGTGPDVSIWDMRELKELYRSAVVDPMLEI